MQANHTNSGSSLDKVVQSAIKFNDGDLHFDSAPKQKPQNPMSSPQEKEKRVINDHMKVQCFEPDTKATAQLSDSTMEKMQASTHHTGHALSDQIPSREVKTSQFVPFNPLFKKTPCNWQIKGNFEAQKHKREELDAGFKHASIKNMNSQRQGHEEIKVQRSNIPRSQHTLSFQEQCEVNLMKLAAKKTSRRQLSKDCLGNQDHGKKIRACTKERPSVFGNGRLYAPAVRRVFNQKVRNTQSKPTNQNAIKICYEIKVLKPQFSDFRLNKRHHKMIEEANQLDFRDHRRARARAQEHAFLKWKCLTAKRNPVAFALRFAKYSLTNLRKEQIEEKEKVEIYKTDELCNKTSQLDENRAQSGNLIDSEVFEYEVIKDENEFQELLTFFFEKRALCQNPRNDKWVEFLEAKNQDILPRLETIDFIAQGQCCKIVSMRKSLKKLLNPDIFQLLAINLKKVRQKVYRIKQYGPKRVFGEYVGDKMIGLTHIPSFNIMINQRIHTVKIRERKMQEKGWLKVIDQFSEDLFESSFFVHQLECLLEAARDREALERINFCLFFLLEVKCPEQLLNACICIAKDDFIIKSTIELPTLRNRNAFAAYMKVMTTEDLSKFTLFGSGFEVNVSVSRERIKDFVIKLDQMKRKRRLQDDQISMQAVRKRDAKDANKNDSGKGPGQLIKVQSKLSSYQFDSSKARTSQHKNCLKDEEAKPVVISLGRNLAPRQSSMQFLSFGEDQN